MYKNRAISVQQQSLQETEVPRLISEALHKCRQRIGREQVARSLGISVHLLNAYACSTLKIREKESGQFIVRRKAAFPARLIELFCEITQDDALQRHVLGERLRLLLEIGEAEAEQRQRLSKLAQANSEGEKKAGVPAK